MKRDESPKRKSPRVPAENPKLTKGKKGLRNKKKRLQSQYIDSSEDESDKRKGDLPEDEGEYDPNLLEKMDATQATARGRKIAESPNADDMRKAKKKRRKMVGARGGRVMKNLPLMKSLPVSELSVNESGTLALLLCKTREWINELGPSSEKRVPFYYNWDPEGNPRYLCRRLIERYPDLAEENRKYAKLETKKAEDLIELFARNVRCKIFMLNHKTIVLTLLFFIGGNCSLKRTLTADKKDTYCLFYGSSMGDSA